ncbi:hypothetical protein [Streptomyces sp. I8-5]|uniref:hypothetical protein n=1 Tax=Streptomyces sp. I8-5 TaxID=3104277 RepID=UPI00386DCE33
MGTVKHDGLNWHAYAHVDKYDPDVVRELTEYLGYEPTHADFQRLSVDPSRVVEADGNLLVNGGLQRITNRIIGTTADAFSNSLAIVGVGSTATSASAGDTVLGANNTAANGSVGSWYQGVDVGYPTAVGGVITAVSTFASADANFAWAEWCWGVATTTVVPDKAFATASTSGVMLNHKIAALGTKASGASWVFTTTVTLS